MQNDTNFFKIARNWGWLKLLLPAWAVAGGIPLLLVKHHNTKNVLLIALISFFFAVTLTIFFIKCYILYVKETQKKMQEINDLEEEIRTLEAKKHSNSKDN